MNAHLRLADLGMFVRICLHVKSWWQPCCTRRMQAAIVISNWSTTSLGPAQHEHGSGQAACCRFGCKEPERVCDRCYDVLKPADLQNALAGHFSKAAQLPIHDVTDWTSMRAWLNNPLTSSLEQDIYKCSNILGCDAASYTRSGQCTVVPFHTSHKSQQTFSGA